MQPNFPIIILILVNGFHKFARSRGLNSSASCRRIHSKQGRSVSFQWITIYNSPLFPNALEAVVPPSKQSHATRWKNGTVGVRPLALVCWHQYWHWQTHPPLPLLNNVKKLHNWYLGASLTRFCQFCKQESLMANLLLCRFYSGWKSTFLINWFQLNSLHSYSLYSYWIYDSCFCQQQKQTRTTARPKMR